MTYYAEDCTTFPAKDREGLDCAKKELFFAKRVSVRQFRSSSSYSSSPISFSPSPSVLSWCSTTTKRSGDRSHSLGGRGREEKIYEALPAAVWGASYAQGGYSPNQELGERFFFYLGHDGKWANSPPQKHARYLLSWVHPGERGRQILIREGLPLLLPLLLSLSLQLFHHLDPGQEKASLEAEARCDSWAAGGVEGKKTRRRRGSLTHSDKLLPSFLPPPLTKQQNKHFL